MRKHALIAAMAAVLCVPAAAGAAERANATVSCKPVGQGLVYDCMIALTGRKSGKPMAGAKITISADMPSMPMAHNVKPVRAMATGKPGMYHARIKLEMRGEWALKLRISGPARDLVVRKVQFGVIGAGKMDHGSHKKMDHGSDKMKYGK